EIEDFEDLVQHLAVLAGRAEDRHGIWSAAERHDDGRELYRLGPRTEDDERLQDGRHSRVSAKPIVGRSTPALIVGASTRARDSKGTQGSRTGSAATSAAAPEQAATPTHSPRPAASLELG